MNDQGPRRLGSIHLCVQLGFDGASYDARAAFAGATTDFVDVCFQNVKANPPLRITRPKGSITPGKPGRPVIVTNPTGTRANSAATIPIHSGRRRSRRASQAIAPVAIATPHQEMNAPKSSNMKKVSRLSFG